jgi:hypothetical protein
VAGLDAAAGHDMPTWTDVVGLNVNSGLVMAVVVVGTIVVNYVIGTVVGTDVVTGLDEVAKTEPCKIEI